MILSAIAAMAENRVIGTQNDLPWNIPEDMTFFRTKTKGAVLIMGRKTFESLGQPLPGRYHIVITRNSSYAFEHERVTVVDSLSAAVAKASSLMGKWPEEVFIAGGGEIYRQALGQLDRIYLTRIHQDFAGDARFPEFEQGGRFTLVEKQPRSGPPPFDFELWERPETGR